MRGKSRAVRSRSNQRTNIRHSSRNVGIMTNRLFGPVKRTFVACSKLALHHRTCISSQWITCNRCPHQSNPRSQITTRILCVSTRGPRSIQAPNPRQKSMKSGSPQMSTSGGTIPWVDSSANVVAARNAQLTPERMHTPLNSDQYSVLPGCGAKRRNTAPS